MKKCSNSRDLLVYIKERYKLAVIVLEDMSTLLYYEDIQNKVDIPTLGLLGFAFTTSADNKLECLQWLKIGDDVYDVIIKHEENFLIHHTLKNAMKYREVEIPDITSMLRRSS